MPAGTDQPGHLLDQHIAVPDFDEVGIDPHVDFFPDQTTGDGIGVALDLDRALRVDADATDPRSAVQFRGRQLAKDSPLLFELGETPCVSLAHQLLEEVRIFLTGGEVPTAPKQQGLFNGRLQMTVGGLDIPVFMGFPNVDPLRSDSVVLHQVTVSRLEIVIVRKVVDRRTQAVAAMLAGNASQLPQGVLQTATEGLERLGETNRNGLPIGVGEREMVEQVLERLTADRNPQRPHVGKIRCAQIPGKVDLGKHDFPVRPASRSPRLNPTFKRPSLVIRKPPFVLFLEPSEEGKGTQLGLGLQSC